jgi:hypothetical protein
MEVTTLEEALELDEANFKDFRQHFENLTISAMALKMRYPNTFELLCKADLEMPLNLALFTIHQVNQRLEMEAKYRMWQI